MNEKTLLLGNRECSHKFQTMPIKHPRCGQFVTPIKDVICYPLNINILINVLRISTSIFSISLPTTTI